jgi:hypothetical protein
MERTRLKRHGQTLEGKMYIADQKMDLPLIPIDCHGICIIDLQEFIL